VPLVSLLGAERYGIKVKDLAKELRKSPDTITQAIARAARKRATGSTIYFRLA
jgi:Mn-dependent DtxR family transcriptional regulator